MTRSKRLTIKPRADLRSTLPKTYTAPKRSFIARLFGKRGT